MGEADSAVSRAVLNLEETVAGLLTLVEHQNRRLEQFERHRGESTAGWDGGDRHPVTAMSGKQVSRRAMLRGAASVSAGAVGVAMVGGFGSGQAYAAPASASYYTAYGADASFTPNGQVGFNALDPRAGFAVGAQAFGSQAGVVGATGSVKGYGILGLNQSDGHMAVGTAGQAPRGIGVLGNTTNGTGVAGNGMYGIGVAGASQGAVGVYATTTSKDHAGLLALHPTVGDGMHAFSKFGRGAVLTGGSAPLNLVPSESRSHPNSGHAGDLFVDAYHRLWYCRGGNPPRWKQLA